MPVGLEKEIIISTALRTTDLYYLNKKYFSGNITLKGFCEYLNISKDDVVEYLRDCEPTNYFSREARTWDGFYVIETADGYQTYWQDRGAKYDEKLVKTFAGAADLFLNTRWN